MVGTGYPSTDVDERSGCRLGMGHALKSMIQLLVTSRFTWIEMRAGCRSSRTGQSCAVYQRIGMY